MGRKWVDLRFLFIFSPNGQSLVGADIDIASRLRTAHDQRHHGLRRGRLHRGRHGHSHLSQRRWLACRPGASVDALLLRHDRRQHGQALKNDLEHGLLAVDPGAHASHLSDDGGRRRLPHDVGRALQRRSARDPGRIRRRWPGCLAHWFIGKTSFSAWDAGNGQSRRRWSSPPQSQQPGVRPSAKILPGAVAKAEASKPITVEGGLMVVVIQLACRHDLVGELKDAPSSTALAASSLTRRLSDDGRPARGHVGETCGVVGDERHDPCWELFCISVKRVAQSWPGTITVTSAWPAVRATARS